MNVKTKRNLARLWLYARHFAAYAVPDALYGWRFRRTMMSLDAEQRRMLAERVDYYCRMPQGCSVGGDEDATRRQLSKAKARGVADTTTAGRFTFPWRRKHKMALYFFDLYHTMRLFPRGLRFNYFFGDIAEELPVPILAKTRPVAVCSNTVLCKLNSFRHFNFPADSIPFEGKRDMLVFRNHVNGQPWRTAFIHRWSGHPLCDVGQVNPGSDVGDSYLRPFMPMAVQLEYKFIACIEGNDVATNLKWVMASNSVAVMPRPRIESWFMEARLVPGVHYIEVKADYSDVEDKLRYYIAHPAEAKAIVESAHEYIRQFQDAALERCVQYGVVRRYFEQTGQM